MYVNYDDTTATHISKRGVIVTFEQRHFWDIYNIIHSTFGFGRTHCAVKFLFHTPALCRHSHSLIEMNKEHAFFLMEFLVENVHTKLGKVSACMYLLISIDMCLCVCFCHSEGSAVLVRYRRSRILSESTAGGEDGSMGQVFIY